MNVLLLGRQAVTEKNDVSVLANHLQDKAGSHLTIEQAFFENILFEIGEDVIVSVLLATHQKKLLNSYTLVIMIGWSHAKVYEDMAHAVALYCQKIGVRVWNSELLTARSMTKLSQLVRASIAGLHIPQSVFSMDHQLALDALSNTGFPVVCKDVTASRGRHNYLAKNASRVQELFSLGRPLILQEFINNDSSDIRFFVVGGKVRLAIRRVGASDSHLTNISAGGQADIVPLTEFDDKLLAEVEKVGIIFQRELCGVDYMFDQQRQYYVFLEVNLTPQIVNGVFVDNKINALIDALEETEE